MKGEVKSLQRGESSPHAAAPTVIPFNRPYLCGRELEYVSQAISAGAIASDGCFAQKCAVLMEQRFGIHRVLLVPSGTAALEMTAILCDLAPGDEVIMPSYTFVSTASAVARLGAKPVFVDIRPDTLNIDEMLIEQAITPRTRAIFVVHYAGVACEMDTIMAIAKRHRLIVVEDAAQGVNAYYKGRALGSIGQLGCYSFHDTKNYVCGEGGSLCINDPALVERAEIIRDKGTNRRQFFRGQVDKYTWVDVGSSYVMSELCAAVLYGQLENLVEISVRRHEIYQRYHELLQPLARERLLQIPNIPGECTSNYHIFYILLPTSEQRDGLLRHLQSQGIHAVFHYVPLHTSPMGQQFGGREGDLPVTEDVASRILRLPIFGSMSTLEQGQVIDALAAFLTDDETQSRAAGQRVSAVG